MNYITVTLFVTLMLQLNYHTVTVFCYTNVTMVVHLHNLERSNYDIMNNISIIIHESYTKVPLLLHYVQHYYMSVQVLLHCAHKYFGYYIFVTPPSLTITQA